MTELEARDHQALPYQVELIMVAYHWVHLFLFCYLAANSDSLPSTVNYCDNWPLI